MGQRRVTLCFHILHPLDHFLYILHSQNPLPEHFSATSTHKKVSGWAVRTFWKFLFNPDGGNKILSTSCRNFVGFIYRVLWADNKDECKLTLQTTSNLMEIKRKTVIQLQNKAIHVSLSDCRDFVQSLPPSDCNNLHRKIRLFFPVFSGLVRVGTFVFGKIWCFRVHGRQRTQSKVYRTLSTVFSLSRLVTTIRL